MAYKWLVQEWQTLFPALMQANTEEEIKRICEAQIAAWRARPSSLSERNKTPSFGGPSKLKV